MSASKLKDISVLAIDDDLDLRKVEKKILEKLGVKNVLTANSARTALELLNRGDEEIDVILLDLNMPFRNGITFLRSLRQNADQRIAELPVIIVSAEESSEVEDKLTELNVSGFVKKPIKPELLKSEILEAI